MNGKIIKGIGGFYYVYVEGSGIWECRARGIFRKKKVKPLVGDNVEISVTSEADREASLDEILERKNSLIRPAAANVDQALVVFAAASPQPNFNLLDRFLISMEAQDIPTIICFNKMDLTDEQTLKEYASIYERMGCPVLTVSVKEGQGLERVRDLLRGKTTIVAGPSGVGKSSMTNALFPEAQMEVGEISRKIERGKQTTRHTEIHRIEEDTYFLDTPGFSSLYLEEIEYEQLPLYYPEFQEHFGQCRFQGCMHLSEPDCAVKAAVEAGEIHRSRYDNYVLLAKELKDRKKKY